MIKWQNKNYYSPKEAAEKFKVPRATIYYWADNNSKDLDILDLDDFCKDLPLDPKELNSRIYIGEDDLKKKTRDLKK